MGCLSSKPLAGGHDRPAFVPSITERDAYDADMRLHLLAHSTPHKVELTLQAAALFVARARLAHTEVKRRRARTGCASEVALLPSPSVTSAAEERHRAQMSREEKIQDGLELLL